LSAKFSHVFPGVPPWRRLDGTGGHYEVAENADRNMEDQAHGADVGADAYITKGAFNDDRLIEAVRNFV